MKRTLWLVVLGGLLGGCTVGSSGMSVNLGLGGMIGRHVGLGTSINIPVSLDKTLPSGSTEAGEAVDLSKEQTLAYFDAEGNSSTKAVPGGYYRRLISKRNDQEYLVQDFYGDNDKKRTDPMILPRERLFEFQAHPHDGSLTVYAYNGNVMRQQVFSGGKLIGANYRYPAGHKEHPEK